jgi:hypothetical protein
MASGRPVYSRMRAVKVTGSPFNTFADAEAACNTMLGVLELQPVALLRQKTPSPSAILSTAAAWTACFDCLHNDLIWSYARPVSVKC